MKTATEFIEFFEAIPEEKWTTGTFKKGDQCCAEGHLRQRRTRYRHNIERLEKLLRPVCSATTELSAVVFINDGLDLRFPQPTPKQRILAALREIQAKEQQASI
jgi:hypothetical protein